MSEVTPMPEPKFQRLSDLQSGVDNLFTVYQLQEYGAAEYQRALKDAVEAVARHVPKTVPVWASYADAIHALGARK
jgi:hypothetical protein